VSHNVLGNWRFAIALDKENAKRFTGIKNVAEKNRTKGKARLQFFGARTAEQAVNSYCLLCDVAISDIICFFFLYVVAYIEDIKYSHTQVNFMMTLFHIKSA